MKVFRMDDCTWWAAETLEAASADYLKETGMTSEEAFGGEQPEELTDAEMDELQFTDTDEDDVPSGIERSFRDELNRRIAAGAPFPQLFASTEY